MRSNDLLKSHHKMEMRMNRLSITLILLFVLAGIALAALIHPQAVRALPEYSAQTGEPCATCHISPSGGGPRGPRGQAWVGAGKAGEVFSLIDSLDFLGVKIEADPQDFISTGQPVQPAQPLQTAAESSTPLDAWLREHDGN